MTQPYNVLHASKLFQDWLSALKERALLQTNHQSQAMLRARYQLNFRAKLTVIMARQGGRRNFEALLK